ncbi:MAG: nitrate reductase cytochrome c-type subunit [Sulfurovum sp.]|nr:nitrate reductase cytochrome c-type subunit [Sulfurovum sp.]MCB4744143.1 nitrate reductase cytochrome c-type subunit [Sulfurovum sp.]MCB4746001.1 nitrate reductase cytochrome c-type subunit [Sulfurovum sp.]MCB4748015.1 nitrate reductase cytochrome c-type subunit [Sulfurovum sp.]MCB4749691.1 nitrate reductase cytochrome c-type subunit [Sulfurovum sp.]
MIGQVKALDNKAIKALANEIKSAGTVKSNKPSTSKAKVIDINAKASDPNRIIKEDLGNKKVIDETVLGLRKKSLFKEDDVAPVNVKENRPAPGTSSRFERAYVNAPPMIPHSVEGLLPIMKNNNQCLGCHMPDVAKGIGATPIPLSHFTNYRPETVLKNGEMVKEGKVVGLHGDLGNVGDIKLAKVKKLNHLYQGRFNCSQCHAPQAKVQTAVANTFRPDGLTGDMKTRSNLFDTISEGVK